MFEYVGLAVLCWMWTPVPLWWVVLAVLLAGSFELLLRRWWFAGGAGAQPPLLRKDRPRCRWTVDDVGQVQLLKD